MIEYDVIQLVDKLKYSQWYHTPNFNLVKGLPILNRKDIQDMVMKKGVYSSITSGSTGESVRVEKTIDDAVWGMAITIREYQWRKWDISKNLAMVTAPSPTKTYNHWGFPKQIYPIQGKVYQHKLETIDVLQEWFEQINPHYIYTYPTILEELDLSRISNLIDVKSTGEKGGTSYSTEECGVIAISCPDNPSVYHVMENIILEVGKNGEAIVTCLTNPYIKRYNIEIGRAHV